MFNELKIKIRRLLVWSQKYTQTDMVYLAEGGFWLTLGQMVSTAASFLLAIAFANLLDPITYGNYRYVLSLIGMLSVLTLTGMGIAITQATARGLEGSFYTGFKTKLKWSLLASLASIGLAGYYWLQGNNLLPIPLLISATFLPLMQASQVYKDLLIGKKLFDIQTKYSTLSQIISSGIIIVVLFLTKNLFWLIAAYLVSYTFLNYFFYLITKLKFKPNKKEDPKTLSYGKHLSLITIFNHVASYIDRFLIFHYLGAAELAIYHFATLPPEQIKGLFKNIQSLALPKFSEKTKKELKSTIFKKAGKFFLILLPITGFYILVAPLLYKIFFPQYLDAIFYSQIFILYLLFTPATLSTVALQSQKAQKQLYQLNISGPIIKIILFFLLVNYYGLLGVILARVISNFLTSGLSLALVRKFK